MSEPEPLPSPAMRQAQVRPRKLVSYAIAL